MQLTDAMLQAAVRKAVEVKLLPKAGFIDVIEENWQKVKAVVEAALAEADDGRHTTVPPPAGPEAAFAEKCREDWEAEKWGIGPYCRECGNRDREKFACIDNFANGTGWRCKVCGHEFHTVPKPPEE
jgi:hypothetical protein